MGDATVATAEKGREWLAVATAGYIAGLTEHAASL
jgi:creatinine amidohydrolase/Fe(II)-dependent formamide hydrolase-like protein